MQNEQSRSRHTVHNAFLGFFNKIVNILLPFVIRTVLIYVMGIKYAGLNGLFSSVLLVLNLAELGIGSAVVYCMYKPMAEKDTETICALLRYMRRIYHCIGAVMAVLGLLLIPALPTFIKGSVPDGLSITALYLIYLLNTILGYFFFAYKATLLNASQEIGVVQMINGATTLTQGILQVVLLLVFRNYYLFLMIMPVTTLLNNFWIAYITRKKYPQYVCRGSLQDPVKKAIYRQVKGLVISRLAVTTRNAFDSIFISSFIGLTAVGIYGNYYYISSAATNLLVVLTMSMAASVGNSLVTESVEKNYRDMRKFNFMFNWIVGYFTCLMLFLYQPFMKVWVGEEYLFPSHMVILFCAYFYFQNTGGIRAVYHDAAGLWWEARHRAVAESVLNIVLNIILTSTLGVFGTILGTLISLILVNYIWGTQIVFKYYFVGISPRQYYLDNGCYGIATAAISLVLGGLFYILPAFSPFLTVGIRAVLVTVLFNLLYLLLFSRTELFAQGKQMILRILHRS